tara:strand:- start:290 stop:961 length:672 start_codon:yes stop_codon:yes gene_type:complete
MPYNNILKIIKGKKIVLFGEIHGTKEILKLLSDFLSIYAQKNDFNLCMEIPNENQKFVVDFLKTGNEQHLEKMPFFKFFKKSDGRNSKEYYELIKNIYTLNSKFNRKIKIFFIDINQYNDQNKREEALANNILKHSSEKITFVILGSIHATKHKINFNNFEITPTGFHLNKKLNNNLISINLAPKKGKFFNLEIKEVHYDKSFERYFDYTHYLEKVTPCSFLK